MGSEESGVLIAVTRESMERLEKIAEQVCELCHWPFVCADQDELYDRCAACRPIIDMANLVERLERKDESDH